MNDETAANEGNVEDLPPHPRRRFFAESLRRLIRPAADFIERRLPIELPVVPTVLRPPGALPEPRFVETCLRCGRCVDACPADAIATLSGGDQGLLNTPYVDPNRQACVICDDLACMKVCPSGALRLVDRMQIRMGLARVDHGLCVRSAGEDCTICVDRCPIGAAAIGVDDAGRIKVIEPEGDGPGCTGCGVCQQQCPTRPERAIRIHPS